MHAVEKFAIGNWKIELVNNDKHKRKLKIHLIHVLPVNNKFHNFTNRKVK